MSYCRSAPGHSDVYMYPNSSGIICSACKLTNNPKIPPDPIFKRKEKALKHLHEHREAGHLVPDHAIERLEEEIIEETQNE